MSAEILRRAAALMRERAEAVERVHASPWKPMGAGSVAYPMMKRISGTVAETFPRGGSVKQADTTEHIASWHPAVALAVAEWLLSVADRHGEILASFAPGSRAGAVTAAENVTGWTEALAVARAYLGEAS